MTINKFVKIIMGNGLFKTFSANELLDIFNDSSYRIKRYNKGQVIYLNNEVCNSMDVILNGDVSIQKIDEEGNVLKVAVFTITDILGANLMFSSRNVYPMTVVADTDVIILHIYEQLVIDLSQKNVEFMSGLLRTISDKTLVLTDKIDSISLKTIRMRINDFLQYEYRIQNNKRINLNMTKKDLAERLGIQRTSLSRELNKMKKEGLIDYDSKTITIKNI